MSGQVDDRLKDLPCEHCDVSHERPEQAAPGAPVRPAEDLGRGRHGSLEHRGAAAIERVGDRRIRMHQVDPSAGKIDRAEER